MLQVPFLHTLNILRIFPAPRAQKERNRTGRGHGDQIALSVTLMQERPASRWPRGSAIRSDGPHGPREGLTESATDLA